MKRRKWSGVLLSGLFVVLGNTQAVQALDSTSESHGNRAGVTKLTESRVVGIAAREAPGVKAAQQRVLSAEAERNVAHRARFPDLVLTARYTRLSSIPERQRTFKLPFPDGTSARLVLPEFLDVYNARAALVVPLTDAWLGLAASVRALGRVASAKRLEVEAVRAQVTYESRAAFLYYRRAEGGRKIATVALEIASVLLEDQARRVNAGMASPSSSLAFETARNAALARLHLAEAETAVADANVRTFLPRSLARTPLSLEEENQLTPFDRGVEDSPLLRAAEVAVTAADARIDAESLLMLPRLLLVAGADVSAPSQRTLLASKLEAIPSWDVTLQLEWSLSSFTTGMAKREGAVAEREKLRAEVEQTRRQLEAQATSAMAAKSSAEARVVAARAAVATAVRLAESRRSEFAAGFTTSLEVTAAENERVRAELERSDAELELKLAVARLAFVGGYVERGT